MCGRAGCTLHSFRGCPSHGLQYAYMTFMVVQVCSAKVNIGWSSRDSRIPRKLQWSEMGQLWEHLQRTGPSGWAGMDKGLNSSAGLRKLLSTMLYSWELPEILGSRGNLERWWRNCQCLWKLRETGCVNTA